MFINNQEIKNVYSVLYKEPSANTFEREVFMDKMSRNTFMDNLASEGKEVFSIGYTPITSHDLIKVVY